MSSLFSDPPFARGTTLLNNEVIELDPSGNPIAGVEIVGAVKVFPDAVPGTGPAAIRNSNRLVYCMAARYTPVDGVTKLNAGGTGADKGKWFVLDRRGPLGTFSTLAAAADITDGRMVGVLDEYLNVEVRPNDIVWLVVKGPATTQKGNTIVVPGGLGIEVSSGLSVTKATTANMVAQAIDPVLLKTGTASSGSTSLTVTDASGIVAEMPVTGAGIASGCYVVSIVGTTVTLSAAATAAISAGQVFFGGSLRTATTCRVNVLDNAI
jgi:hypothetical protein